MSAITRIRKEVALLANKIHKTAKNLSSSFKRAWMIVKGRNRVIDLSDSALNVLKQYKIEQAEERLKLGNIWTDSGKIFVQWNGSPMFPTTPTHWFSKWIKKNNLPKITFHQLRHTNASLLISEGVDVVTVSKRLGHSKPSTTTDIYSHALSKRNKEAADKLENLFNTHDETLRINS